MNTNSNLYKKLLGVGLGSALAISGAFIVAPFEGKENKAYLDPVNIVTICYGSTKNVKLGALKTEQGDWLDHIVKVDTPNGVVGIGGTAFGHIVKTSLVEWG